MSEVTGIRGWGEGKNGKRVGKGGLGPRNSKLFPLFMSCRGNYASWAGENPKLSRK